MLWCGYCSVSFQSFVLRHWCPQHQETTENESNKERVPTVTLACMVLHNISIERGDSIARKLDLSVDPRTQEKGIVRKLLQMTDCRSSKDTSDEAVKVRDALCEKVWVEKETGKV